MLDFTSNSYSIQLPLFNFHEIRSSFFSEEETTFYRYLATVEKLLTSEEKTYLFSEPYTGRKRIFRFSDTICSDAENLPQV